MFGTAMRCTDCYNY